MQILVLTQNILTESHFQEKLQGLNHEVFCSKNMLDLLKKQSAECFGGHLYHMIILSETLSNREIISILPCLRKLNAIILRKIADEPNSKEKESLEGLDIDGWVTSNISKDSLREVLSEKEKLVEKEETNIVSFPHVQSPTLVGTYEQLLSFFSNTEKRVMNLLVESEARVVSREEFCKRLWEDKPTNSHLSQLSLTVRNIRLKLINHGLPEDILKTEWGRGYRLSHEFFDFYPLKMERIKG
ncbi:winged helix-turn-helix domain-containing protein [Enterococcus sp. DIV0756]|uniref:winged helix-turn-helix domain-containing protein n=1 Tax=Enterococcus sp. DIV0756 TaxID=2774636 RepID=UPI003F228189